MSGSRRNADTAEALVTHLYQSHGRSMLAYATRLTDDRRRAEVICENALVWATRHPDLFSVDHRTARYRLLVRVASMAPGRTRPVRRAESGNRSAEFAGGGLDSSRLTCPT